MLFPSWKMIFKQSWHFLDTSLTSGYLSSSKGLFLSQSWQILDSWWIKRESSWILDNFSTASGSIKLVFLCLSFVSQHLYLSPTISSIPSSIAASIPLDTCIYRDLLRAYIIFSCDLQLLSFDLSLDSSLIFSHKHSHLTPILILKVSSRFFKFFLTW